MKLNFLSVQEDKVMHSNDCLSESFVVERVIHVMGLSSFTSAQLSMTGRRFRVN